MEHKLCIQSDYKDFYDIKSQHNGIIYSRKYSNCMQRGSALKYIKGLGVNTLEIKPVSSFSYLDGKLVVYTDPKKHNGLGKIVCSYEEARAYYNNMPASKYIEDTNGFTIKVLQIGKRRFNITFKKDESHNLLEEGNIVDFKELPSSYSSVIKLPIFSIDYIPNNNIMIATDFNEVDNLSRLSIENYMKSDEIIEEIINSLMIHK